VSLLEEEPDEKGGERGKAEAECVEGVGHWEIDLGSQSTVDVGGKGNILRSIPRTL
jgi:hypothetical protein